MKKLTNISSLSKSGRPNVIGERPMGISSPVPPVFAGFTGGRLAEKRADSELGSSFTPYAFTPCDLEEAFLMFSKKRSLHCIPGICISTP